MLFSWLYSDKVILVVLFVLIIMLLVDTSLIRLSELIRLPSASDLTNLLFILIGVVYTIGQFLILGYVRLKGKEIRIHGNLYLNYIDKLMNTIQYILVVIIALVTLQIVATSYYNTVMLVLSNAISYAFLISMMSLLAQRFFSWYRSNKNAVVLLYGLSSVTVALNAIFTFVQIGIMSQSMPIQVGEQIAGMTRFSVSGSILSIFNHLYFGTSIISFILLWIGTAFLLRHYSKRLGKVKYWIFVSLPLIYFLSQFPASFLILFSASFLASPTFFSVVFTLIFALSNLSGGILFGLAFWTAGRSMAQGSIVRNYMIISAYGLILLFLSNQGNILISTGGPYPPFGLATISLVGLSSYLILIGIYSSAISVSHDVKIRASIRDSVKGQARLLGSIGTAQMEGEIGRKVIRILNEQQENMIEETGVPSSLSEEDIKEYLAELIKEIKGKKHL